ncbi:MAG TPA: radical SAM protein [Candidatus Kapabacteria bacterium]|nr:radical SAM protein [Candidatus Kapabacteria bacterium]
MNEISSFEKDKLIEGNKREYGEKYDTLKWPTAPEAEKASEERNELLEHLFAHHVKSCFSGTKLDCRKMSPGCRICGEGAWSCLFINGRCNSRCFYCPSEQLEIGDPMTNTVPFPNVEDYIDYIGKFGFNGVSISGGEPFLTFEKSLNFAAKIKKRYGGGIYLWLYTNGILVTEEKLKQLRDAGLDEIRFDIGAVDYGLENVKLATHIIDRVTVEIPAIPEEFQSLTEVIPRLKEIGVDFLNLHQLRLTPYNYPGVVGRNYTFLHGPKVTVLESELMALKAIQFVVEHEIELPINYCSFVYKERFQKIAARKRHSASIKKSCEDVTNTGFIRNLIIKGSPNDLDQQVEIFKKNGSEEHLWKQDGTQLIFAQTLWKYIDFNKFSLVVVYHETRLCPAISYHHEFREIRLNNNKSIFIERRPVFTGKELDKEEAWILGKIITTGKSPTPVLEEALWNEILDFERIKPGLAEYF